MTIRVVVVDDEQLPRQRILDLVKDQPDLEVVGEASDGQSALDLILSTKPDVAFLDIQMPELDGFQVISALDDESLPAIVFVSAYDEYAVRAFDVSAVDYLLKPVSAMRFVAMLERVRERLRQQATAAPAVRDAVERASPTATRLTRFVALRGNKHYLIPVSDIHWIESDGNYVRLRTGAQSHLVRDTMKNIEARLNPDAFMRIHRSTIVAIDRIDSIQTREYGEYKIKLKDGTTLVSSRAYGERVRKVIR
ncbi:MAG TPA: LytTR family DNA-binding domain-containing protein [Gemmatimonadaceae bacterium]